MMKSYSVVILLIICFRRADLSEVSSPRSFAFKADADQLVGKLILSLLRRYASKIDRERRRRLSKSFADFLRLRRRFLLMHGKKDDLTKKFHQRQNVPRDNTQADVRPTVRAITLRANPDCAHIEGIVHLSVVFLFLYRPTAHLCLLVILFQI